MLPKVPSQQHLADFKKNLTEQVRLLNRFLEEEIMFEALMQLLLLILVLLISSQNDS